MSSLSPEHLEDLLLTILRFEREKGWTELTLEQLHHKLSENHDMSQSELAMGIREALKNGRMTERNEHHYRLAD